MPVVVNLDKCTGCETCLESCPYDAIVMKDGKAVINEYCNECMTCLSVCPEGAIIETLDAAAREESLRTKAKFADYRDVLVFAEQREGEIAAVSYELLGAGRRLADKRDVGLYAVLLGTGEKEAGELIKWGADKVILCSDSSLTQFNDDSYAQILTEVIQKYKPSIVLAGATPVGRSFLPRVAAKVRTGLTADCTSLEIDSETGNLLQVRPAFGGNIMATILCPDYRPQMATVRPRVMKKGEYQEDRTGEIINMSTDSISCRTQVIETVKEVSEISVNLHEAEFIIAGGRGVGGEKGFKMLEELAEVLGGVVGASRAAVDEGWVSYSHQVGQTGKTVNPKIYIACGISGAVQHLVGMQSSDMIIAINKNPDAPIFNVATYGIVGDMFEIVPLLTKKIKEAKGL
ncbi:MAG: electron transfer flavoprotein subunit alpha [Nitrospiraceae bacterium]|nr:MAG: electron transfer flavoprotein subunit alpha [Nitrospiraceae bacterium]